MTSNHRPIRNLPQERVSPSSSSKILGAGKFVLHQGVLSQSQTVSLDIINRSFLPTTESITSLADGDSEFEENDSVQSQEQQCVHAEVMYSIFCKILLSS